MTDAQLLQFADRLLEGQVEPDEFRTLTVDDARRLSYFLRQRLGTRRTPRERPPSEPNRMTPNPVETRFDALDAIGHALKRGRVSFAEASRLRDLARAGRLDKVREHLSKPEAARR